MPLDAIQGGDAPTNAAITHSILEGRAGPHRDTVLLNAGAALVAAGLAETIGAGAKLAGAAIDSGAARNVLNRYIEVSAGAEIGQTT